MEMLFFIALLSLLWPDGIREHPEAVKANTSKKKKGGGCNRSNQGVDRPAGKRSKRKMWRKQNTGDFQEQVDFLFLKQRMKSVCFFSLQIKI